MYLRNKSKVLKSLVSETDQHDFLLGTSVINSSENELVHVRFDENLEDETTNSNGIKIVNEYSHKNGEIHSIEPHSYEKNLLFTTYYSKDTNKYAGSLYKMNSDDNILEEQLTIKEEDLSLQSIKWIPKPALEILNDNNSNNKILLVFNKQIRVGDLNEGSNLKTQDESDVNSDLNFNLGEWDPHHVNTLIVASNSNLLSFDTRQGLNKPTKTIENVHSPKIQDVDFNPNKPYYVVTGGDDRLIKFWDIRKSLKPVKVLKGHKHWVTKAKYNPFHDQLVLSSSTDSLCNLWRVSSISSAPILEWDEWEEEISKHNTTRNEDMLLKTYKEHEDSIYSIAWSACDAWIFATLSYDGHLKINHVPTTVKYSVIL